MTHVNIPSQGLIDEFVGVSHGDLMRVRELLAIHPSLVGSVATWGETPVQAAAQTGRREIVKLLLSAGAPLDICTAAMLGDIESVAGFLSKDPALARATGAHGLPLIYYPACNGRVDIAELVLSHGAQLNGGEGVATPLHGAIAFGHVAMVAWLLSHGAAPNGLDFLQRSPLQAALDGGDAQSASLLREHGGIAMASGFVEVEAGKLYYEVEGEGPALVLIHAGVAHSGMWDDQFHRFADHFRVIRFDMRGFGKSVSAPGTFSWRQDLLELLKALHIERVALVGLSMGGALVVDFTLEHPEMVTALVPVAAGLSGFNSAHDPVEDDFDARIAAAEQQKDLALVNELELQLWVDGPGQSSSRVPHALREGMRAMNGLALSHTEELRPRRLDPPAAGRLGEIRVPALVVVGDLDTSGVRAACAALSSGIRGAQLVTISGVAHMVNLEQPDKFYDVVDAFLRAHAPAK